MGQQSESGAGAAASACDSVAMAYDDVTHQVPTCRIDRQRAHKGLSHVNMHGAVLSEFFTLTKIVGCRVERIG